MAESKPYRLEIRDRGQTCHHERWLWLVIIAWMIPLCGCKEKGSAAREVFSEKPRITESDYVSLQKIYSIDVTEISLFNKENQFKRFIDFDEKGKMFIADGFKRNIYVYDEGGKFETTFGGPGQGPREFSGAISQILVDGEQLRVFYSFSQIKNLSLRGDYISQDIHSIQNNLITKIAKKNYYVLRGVTDSEFKKLDFVISAYDGTLSIGRDLFTSTYPPGLRGPQYDFLFSNWMHVSERGDIYFPEAVLEKHSLLHLDGTGALIKKFGRAYDPEKYSPEAEARFYRLYKKWVETGNISFPAYPPVIRLMFEDERGNVWVVTGETSEDNGNPDFENTVDVFNPKGEWLYALKTKIVSRYVLYHKGKIFRVRVMDEEPYKQFIDVYKIVYND